MDRISADRGLAARAPPGRRITLLPFAAHPREHVISSIFALPDHRSTTFGPALLASDEEHFARVARALERRIADSEHALEEALAEGADDSTARVDREARIRHRRARLRALRAVRLDTCLGRMDLEDGRSVHIGRIGVQDDDGSILLLDWRSDAAAPFFSATRAAPQGVRSRRRYRWSGGRIRDCWDESVGAAVPGAGLDEDSALLASLEAARTPRMSDALSTLAADQDAIIRADARRALVVDGGPGTGKTVVALHRAAYLLHADPRLREGRAGGILVVGPHRPYLEHIADVLPSLGEDVAVSTLAELVPEGEQAAAEADPAVAALKADARMVQAIGTAVGLHEQPPTLALEVETSWGPVMLGPDEWEEAFDAVEPGVPHDGARERILEELAEIALARLEGASAQELRRELGADEEIEAALHRAWPQLDPLAVVAALWADPAHLQRCAPWLAPEEVALLGRSDPRAWTVADLPLLDAARDRVGDPGAEDRRRRREHALAAEAEQMDTMVDQLIASDASEMHEMAMLRGEDLRRRLAAESLMAEDLTGPGTDALAGPFAHVIVDEAQELTDAQWPMVLRRCPSRRLTVVGDRAQSRSGFPESWTERLERVGIRGAEVRRLTLNYRTPAEIMEAAEPVIRTVLPDANVPESIRRTGAVVRRGRPEDLAAVLEEWLSVHDEGTVCVIGGSTRGIGGDRVRELAPADAKGLEFDLVVLVEPEALDAVDRYVAMTRSTRDLAVLSALPASPGRSASRSRA